MASPKTGQLVARFPRAARRGDPRHELVEIVNDQQLTPTAKLEAIEEVLQAERDPDEEAEEARDRERLS